MTCSPSFANLGTSKEEQWLSRYVVVKQETNSWKYMWIMGGYLFGLAYLASLITYQLTNVLVGL